MRGTIPSRRSPTPTAWPRCSRISRRHRVWPPDAARRSCAGATAWRRSGTGWCGWATLRPTVSRCSAAGDGATPSRAWSATCSRRTAIRGPRPTCCGGCGEPPTSSTSCGTGARVPDPRNRVRSRPVGLGAHDGGRRALLSPAASPARTAGLRGHRVELRERRVVGRSDARAVRCFAALVGASALGACALLAVGDAAWPSVGPVLLLGCVLLLAVNRFALFPNEHAATAEAAVLLAAVVGFRDHAAFLGPLVLALLVGPLDMLHWTQRSYLRMAYNAGNRGLSALAAAGAFAALTHSLDDPSSVLASGVAAVVSVAAFAAVDFALSVALMRLQGEQLPAAARAVLGIDVLAVPIALFGVACGFLVPAIGWWAVAIALLPAVFVPELALARARWRVAVVRDVAIVTAVVGTVVSLAVLGPRPPLTVLGALLALAWIVGTVLGTDRWRVPPLLALLVTAGAVVTDDRSAFLVAALTALTGSIAAAWARGRLLPHAFVLVLALVGAAGATLVARSSSSTPPGVALGALLAGVVFGVVAVLPGGARQRVVQLVWSAPVLAGAVAWALLWR